MHARAVLCRPSVDPKYSTFGATVGFAEAPHSSALPGYWITDIRQSANVGIFLRASDNHTGRVADLAISRRKSIRGRPGDRRLCVLRRDG
jgi:hypothetical protein